MGHKTLWCWARNRDWELSALRHPTRLNAFAFHPAGRTIAYCGGGGPAGGYGSAADGSVIRFHPLSPAGEVAPDRLDVEHGAPPGERGFRYATDLSFSPDGR